MKNYSLIIMSLLLLAGFYSCSNDEGTRPGRYDGIVTFDASVKSETENKTRVTGITWDAGDAIGIYMDHSAENAENRKYTTGGDGKFTPANLTSDGIKFPETGAADFYAYYPYTTNVTNDLKVPVDVTDQSKNLEIMYADKVNVTNGDTPVALAFERVLTKLTFVVTDEAGVNLNNLAVTLKGLETKGNLDLTTGDVTAASGNIADITAVTTSATSSANAKAIIIPVASTTDFVVSFKNSNIDFDYEFTDGTALAAGNNYVYDVNIKADGQITVTSTIKDWTEVPGGNIDINVGGGTGGGEGGVIFSETFGNGNYPSGNRPKIAEFTDFDEKGVTYSDASGFTDIRSSSTISAHAWFPATRDAYLTISGVNTADYSDITLSFDLAANLYNDGDAIDLNVMTVSFNGTTYTLPSTPVSKANGDDGKFYTFEFSGLDAVASGVLEFHASSAANTMGLRLDNITIIADDGGEGPPPAGDEYANGVLADFNFQLGGTAIGELGVALPLTQTGASAHVSNATLTVVGFPETAVNWTGSNSSLWRGNWDTNTTDKYWLTTYPLTKKIAAGKKIEIGYKAWGTSTAPKEFAVEISTDNSSWGNIDNYDLTATANAAYSFTYTVPADIEASTMYIRIRPTSTTPVSAASLNANGNVRLSQMKVELAD